MVIFDENVSFDHYFGTYPFAANTDGTAFHAKRGTYDDPDGWYDHQPPVIVNGSNTSLDQPICSSAPVRLAGTPVRCGFSQRLPMLVISPWTRANHVSHKLTNTVSVIRFIENNWLGGRRIGCGSYDAVSTSLNGLFSFFAPHFRPVILDPATGAVKR